MPSSQNSLGLLQNHRLSAKTLQFERCKFQQQVPKDVSRSGTSGPWMCQGKLAIFGFALLVQSENCLDLLEWEKCWPLETWACQNWHPVC